MYKSIRYLRIVISLIAMTVPTFALLWGYPSIFIRMQILTAIMAGVATTLLFWVVLTLIYGRIYCSTLCPLGTMMDCVGAAKRIVRRRKSDFRYRQPLTRMQLCFLALGIVTLLSGNALVPTLMDPYSTYARFIEYLIARPLGIHNDIAARYALTSTLIAAGTAISVVAVAWRHGRLICNSVCPVGTALGVAARRSYLHIEIDPDRCTDCKLCEKACKAQCIQLPEMLVDNARCVVCFDCTAVCPHQAISYKQGNYRLKMPMMQSIDPARKGSTAVQHSSHIDKPAKQ